VVSRRLLIVAFGLALPFAGAWPALADQNVRIRGIDVGSFPSVGVTVSVEGAAGVDARDVRVFEDGVQVPLSSVRPLALNRGIDVVLAIDTSNSMRGAPLQTAYAAAREFVTQVPAGVQVGLLTFADRSQIVDAITSDHAAVLGSLASTPATGLGTALYDAVATASTMFTGTAQRNIILLTDGRNNVGTADLEAAVAAARDAHVTVFSVGLEGANIDIDILQQLSRLTSGTYASASANDLRAAYQSLASQLSQQYLITYRSKAPFGTQAILTVELPGGTDDSGFLAPPPHATVGTANAPTALARFFGSPLGVATTVGLTFLAALSLIWLLLGVQVRAGRERQLAHQIPALPRARTRIKTKPEGNPLTAWIPQTVVGAAGRMAQYTGLSAGLDARLERGGLAMRPGEFLAGMALAGVTGILAGGLIGGLVSRGLLGALLLGALGALLPWVLLARAAQKRTHNLQTQLPDVLMVIASSLRAGHSFMQALDMVTKEVGEPSAHEFSRAVTEIRLGRPVNDALAAMSGRIGSEDFDWAVMAINIQRQVGGNLAELLETVAATIRERETLRRQVRVLSGEGRLSVAILTVLPILLATYIFLVVPSYIETLFQKTIGLILLAGSGLLMVVGYLWMRKIVKLDV
jgi:tight adherence protein B